MTQLLQCRSIRSVCYFIILALISTVAPLPLATPANAQLMPTYSVGVVDFMNESGVQGELLSRLATDAVVIEMSKSNRYDVSTTRTQIREQMDKLDLHPPIEKIGLIRLGEALNNDAMLEGSIKSVQLAGSGATRRASVTIICQMIDQASGEVINGAVQTGTSSARVGYTADDEALITEAINNAAFLVVKTMVDYIIPEATVQMNITGTEVMLNKGARDGMKAGMRMIVLRQKEIIGYVEVRDVSAIDCKAKIVKSMRGIQPEDKVRAIFEMPAVETGLKSAPLPSGAPAKGRGGSSNTASKIGKVLIGLAVVYGLYSIFNSGRGNEPAQNIGVAGPMQITWDPSKYGHGQNVVEYQVLRDDFSDGARPVKVMSDPSEIDAGRTSLYNLYGQPTAPKVTYKSLTSNPSTTAPVANTWDLTDVSNYGVTHDYQVRVLYKVVNASSGSSTDTSTAKYYYTPVSNSVTATAIQKVTNGVDSVTPIYNEPTPGDLIVRELQNLDSADGNFTWTHKTGADQYYIRIEAIGRSYSWESRIFTPVGDPVGLPGDERQRLANSLAASTVDGDVLAWRVYARNSRDTVSLLYPGTGNISWVKGDENRARVQALPPSP